MGRRKTTAQKIKSTRKCKRRLQSKTKAVQKKYIEVLQAYDEVCSEDASKSIMVRCRQKILALWLSCCSVFYLQVEKEAQTPAKHEEATNEGRLHSFFQDVIDYKVKHGMEEGKLKALVEILERCNSSVRSQMSELSLCDLLENAYNSSGPSSTEPSPKRSKNDTTGDSSARGKKRKRSTPLNPPLKTPYGKSSRGTGKRANATARERYVNSAPRHNTIQKVTTKSGSHHHVMDDNLRAHCSHYGKEEFFIMTYTALKSLLDNRLMKRHCQYHTDTVLSGDVSALPGGVANVVMTCEECEKKRNRHGATPNTLDPAEWTSSEQYILPEHRRQIRPGDPLPKQGTEERARGLPIFAAVFQHMASVILSGKHYAEYARQCSLLQIRLCSRKQFDAVKRHISNKSLKVENDMQGCVWEGVKEETRLSDEMRDKKGWKKSWYGLRYDGTFPSARDAAYCVLTFMAMNTNLIVSHAVTMKSKITKITSWDLEFLGFKEGFKDGAVKALKKGVCKFNLLCGDEHTAINKFVKDQIEKGEGVWKGLKLTKDLWHRVKKINVKNAGEIDEYHEVVSTAGMKSQRGRKPKGGKKKQRKGKGKGKENVGKNAEGQHSGTASKGNETSEKDQASQEVQGSTTATKGFETSKKDQTSQDVIDLSDECVKQIVLEEKQLAAQLQKKVDVHAHLGGKDERVLCQEAMNSHASILKRVQLLILVAVASCDGDEDKLAESLRNIPNNFSSYGEVFQAYITAMMDQYFPLEEAPYYCLSFASTSATESFNNCLHRIAPKFTHMTKQTYKFCVKLAIGRWNYNCLVKLNGNASALKRCSTERYQFKYGYENMILEQAGLYFNYNDKLLREKNYWKDSWNEDINVNLFADSDTSDSDPDVDD
eukprot:Nk52_evm101s208 gene=Nk52_evmTU101s208